MQLRIFKEQHLIDKPLQDWQPEDFPLIGGIYCLNNGGYHGPTALTPKGYEAHIVLKHKGKPTYPGLADIEKYGLKCPPSAADADAMKRWKYTQSNKSSARRGFFLS